MRVRRRSFRAGCGAGTCRYRNAASRVKENEKRFIVGLCQPATGWDERARMPLYSTVWSSCSLPASIIECFLNRRGDGGAKENETRITESCLSAMPASQPASTALGANGVKSCSSRKNRRRRNTAAAAEKEFLRCDCEKWILGRQTTNNDADGTDERRKARGEEEEGMGTRCISVWWIFSDVHVILRRRDGEEELEDRGLGAQYVSFGPRRLL